MAGVTPYRPQEVVVSRFDIARDGEQLTLTTSMENRLLGVGCLLLALSLFCLAALGFLSLMEESRTAFDRASADTMRFLNPHANQFGFLWAVGSVLTLVLAVVYARKIRCSTLAFSFDRETGIFARNEKPVTRLDHIEFVRINRVFDPEEAYSCRLLVVYNDGYEEFIDESYEEPQIDHLAREIAAFVGVPVQKQ